MAVLVAGVFVVLFGLSGCDDETIVSPFSDRDAEFTIFGFMTQSDSQLVRVIPVRRRLERPDEPATLDVSVRSRAMSTGRIVEWDQVLPRLEDGRLGLQFADSSFGHVFLGRFLPLVGETYELVIEKPDGTTATARTTIPRVQSPVVAQPVVSGDSVVQTVLWPGVDRAPVEILMVYRLASPIFRSEIQIPAAPVYHNGRGTPTPGGWQVDINLNEDVKTVRRFVIDNLAFFSEFPSVENSETFPLDLVDIRMRVSVGDSAWTFADGAPDLARLSQPGAASNVENGFGFFGAIGSEVQTWLLPDAELRREIGFTP